MLKKIAVLLALFVAGVTSVAQTSPGLVYGQVPTPNQWNGYFSVKQDYITPGAAGHVLTSNGSANWVSLAPAPAGNLAGGTANALPYQTAPNVTAFLAQGTGVLQEAAGAPVWTTSPSLVGTNFTGTAASLTAGHVTTNANLTGPITSSGNATAIAAQTGTGSTIVVDTNPVLVGPTLGVALATSINGNIFTPGSSTYTGTAGQIYTFPTTSATIARTDAANTFNGAQVSTGTLFQGGATALSVGGVSNQGVQISANGGPARVTVARFSNDANGPALFLGKSRGTLNSAAGAVASGDDLGQIRFVGDDGATAGGSTIGIEGARVTASVDGAVSTGVIPGRYTISTMTAAGVLTEAVRVDSNQTVGIGGVPALGMTLTVAKKITGAVNSNGIWSAGVVQSDVTSNARMFNTSAATAASAFTLTALTHYNALQGTFGAGSTVTNQYGFAVDSTLTGATNNYGFYGNIASGTNRYNLYMNGTAANYLGGTLLMNSKIESGGTVPTVATNDCGSSTQGAITIGGNNNAFLVTAGTASVTSCAITFGTAWVAAPKACTFSPANSVAAAQGTTLAYISAISTTKVTISGTALASAAYYVQCF